MPVEFAFSHWSGWTSSPAGLPAASQVQTSGTPDAAMVPAMLRRRLDTLGRICAGEILRNLQAGDNLPVIYCSRHGDIERTLSVLLDLARGEPLSPMNFSLAVHNAIAGVLSIHQGITANIISIAALDQGLVPVLLEAAGLIQQGHERVLCAIADVPLPELYRPDCPSPLAPFASCFVIASRGGQAARLDCAGSMPGSRDAPEYQLPQALQFIDFLGSEQRSFTAGHNGSAWVIDKC